MALDARIFFNTKEMAEDVEFIPDDGPAVTITVIIKEKMDFGRGSTGSVVSANGIMRVYWGDFPDMKPAGKVRRKDGSVWVIGQELSSNPMFRKLEIKTRPRALFK
jgi:hypothetical protein